MPTPPAPPTDPTRPALVAPRHPGGRRRARSLAAAAIAALALVGSGCGSGEPTASTGDANATTTAAADAPSTTETTQPPATEAPTTTVDVGSLPQTEDEPTATGDEWARNVDLLWQAIVTDDPDLARPFFFPEGAYLQVKRMTEAEATADYANRLIAYFEEDIHALHRQLGASAADAELVGLDVPAGGAQWIQPGVEYNKGSYWRVQGNQLVYEVGGVQRSFPVVSMISWRGQWYVVHLSSIR